jgi:glutamate carboxypeptidase
MLQLLERLVEAESPSKDPESQAGVQAALISEMEELDFRVRRIPGRATGGHLLAVPRQRQRNRPIQVLIGHCDTVWPKGALGSMPITLRSGRMTGPGVYDMKGGLTVMVYALRALQATGLRPHVTPVAFVNSDEEIGSSESRRVVERLAKIADRVLVLEPALGDNGALKTARKGVGQFTIRVRGRAAHAGLEPTKGVSAILELSHLVQRLFALNDPEQGITVNVGTIDGGMRPNVVAPESTATVDVRVMTLEQARRLERAIRSLRPQTPGATLEVEGGVDVPPMERTPGNRRLWQRARVTARELGIEIEECLAGGGSDGNIASLYAPTLDGLGPIGGGAHAVHEYIQLDSLVERSALLALLLLEGSLGSPSSASPRASYLSRGPGASKGADDADSLLDL